MKTRRHDIAAAIAERSLATADPKELSAEIAAYLLSERRASELDSLMRDVMQYRADHGIVEVIAVSAHPLTDAVRADITTQIRELYAGAKQVIISHRQDDAVLGGVRLELANEQLDMTARSKLNRLKQLTAAGKE